jgi:hypothetical protein
MAETIFRSAGVSTREIDLTGPTAVVPVGIPAGIIGATQKGPAYVPLTLPTINDFVVKFGEPVENLRNGPLAVAEWLKNSQAVTFLRVLGVGQGLIREASGLSAGRVAGAGFVVGDQQPQSASLSGALGDNPNAVAGGVLGRTFMLGCFMSESVGSTLFSDAGVQTSTTSVPIVRGVLMAASGVILTLSSAVGGTNTAPSVSTAAAYTTARGGQTGSVDLSSGKQEFVLFLNGWKQNDPGYPNVITASFDMTAPNYFGKILNKDPLALENAGYLLYAQYDIHPNMAAVTGSGVIVGTSGSSVEGGKERIAFLLTGSATRNSGSVTAPNFENFEDRYETPKSPYVISQNFGGAPQNLFRVWALDDGEYANSNLKISIENIAPSLTDTTKYGTFDLVVRAFNDNDNNRVALESWRNLSLNPSSPRFIAKIIGDYTTFYNWDAAQGSQKLITTGEYPNQSKYIRVSVVDDVLNGEMDAEALPMGFRGVPHLVTSGSAPLGAWTDATVLVSSNPFFKTVQPPVPMRTTLTRGVSPRQSVDKSLYWGVQFENVTSPTEPNASTVPNEGMKSFVKFFPNFHTSFANMITGSNSGQADTAANGIMDADRFNNNLFSLEKVKVVTGSTGNADVTTLVSWSYVRAGGIAANDTLKTRALKVTDLEDPSVRTVAKFNMVVQGGFDGVRIFNVNTKYMTNLGVVEEMSNPTRGYSNGATVKSYLKALELMRDTSEVDIQLLAMPGIRQRFLTDTALRMTEDRFDALFIMDIEEKDVNNNLVTATTQEVSVRNTVTDFSGRGLNSSFGAAYFPDIILRDSFSRRFVRVPPSVGVLGAIGLNDTVAFEWFAPAGYSRGVISDANDTAIQLSKPNLDDLYSVNINPITSFPGSNGVVIWGQKTVLARQSSLERVNVRRLLISLRRDVKKVANRILFEQNRDTTLERFSNLVNPILKKVQDQQGVDRFLVKIDTQTTTQADIENKTIRGKIWIQPTKTLEFLSVDFVLTNRGNFVTG